MHAVFLLRWRCQGKIIWSNKYHTAIGTSSIANWHGKMGRVISIARAAAGSNPESRQPAIANSSSSIASVADLTNGRIDCKARGCAEKISARAPSANCGLIDKNLDEKHLAYLHVIIGLGIGSQSWVCYGGRYGWSERNPRSDYTRAPW